MFRWPFLLAGIYLVFRGWGAGFQADRLPDDLPLTSPERARTLCESPTERFVRIEADLDFRSRAFPTGLRAPGYVSCSPAIVREIEIPRESAADLEPLVGCIVEARVPALPDALVLEMATRRDDSGTERRERLLAPLMGTALGLWALSPPFVAGDRDAKMLWINRDRVAGRLSRFRDLRENFPDLPASAARIAAAYRDEFRAPISDDALVILPDEAGGSSPARASDASYYVLLRGSGRAVFVLVDPGLEDSLGETLSGVLRPHRGCDFADLGPVLGVELPERIGILEPMSAAEYLSVKSGGTRKRYRLGWVLLGAAGLLFIRRRMKFSREMREVGEKLAARADRR